MRSGVEDKLYAAQPALYWPRIVLLEAGSVTRPRHGDHAFLLPIFPLSLSALHIAHLAISGPVNQVHQTRAEPDTTHTLEEHLYTHSTRPEHGEESASPDPEQRASRYHDCSRPPDPAGIHVQRLCSQPAESFLELRQHIQRRDIGNNGTDIDTGHAREAV